MGSIVAVGLRVRVATGLVRAFMVLMYTVDTPEGTLVGAATQTPDSFE